MNNVEYSDVQQHGDLIVQFVADTSFDRKMKGNTKVLTFFQKLRQENPEITRITWERDPKEKADG
ncbi:MAG: hypothetical protein AB7Q01_14135 [Gammaproteobacteria bacterium]